MNVTDLGKAGSEWAKCCANAERQWGKPLVKKKRNPESRLRNKKRNGRAEPAPTRNEKIQGVPLDSAPGLGEGLMAKEEEEE